MVLEIFVQMINFVEGNFKNTTVRISELKPSLQYFITVSFEIMQYFLKNLLMKMHNFNLDKKERKIYYISRRFKSG